MANISSNLINSVKTKQNKTKQNKTKQKYIYKLESFYGYLTDFINLEYPEETELDW